MSHERTIMIMAGGTGGHVYPALAVADALTSKGVRIVWLGTDAGLEARVVPENNYQLCKIDIKGVRGKGILRKLVAPFIILHAMWQSIRIMRKHRPDVVLGMGGFASGPGGVAAWLLRIPLMVHEQNAVAGLTNRILAHFATGVMQAFPDTFEESDKVKTTGNPVRENILAIETPSSRYSKRDNTFRILIVGGSLGARKLNQTLPEVLNTLRDKYELQVKHQTGQNHFEDTNQAYSELSIEAEIMPYIEDMAAVYEWADIVICRAGAMTIAEISVAGVPSVLVPYPYAVDDHQTANARYLSDAACAVLIQESDLSIQSLSDVLSDLLVSREHLLEMAEQVLSLGKPNATSDVASLCLEAGNA